MPTADKRIEMREGNNRTVRFTVYQKGTRIGFAIPATATVELEVERADPDTESPFTPIPALSTDPGADWDNGVVVVDIGPPITDAVGTYAYSLTMTDGTQVVTLAVGLIEVGERPGYPHPTP
jgi:hypothetical protein